MADRRKLTTLDKLRILVEQARCSLCGEKLGALSDTQFDHARALVNGGEDSLENLRGVHVACHAVKTRGRGATTSGSDIGEARKTRQLIKKRLAREAATEKELNCEDDNPEIRLIAKSKKSPSNKSGNSAGRIKSAGFRPPARKQARATGYKRKGV